MYVKESGQKQREEPPGPPSLNPLPHPGENGESSTGLHELLQRFDCFNAPLIMA